MHTRGWLRRRTYTAVLTALSRWSACALLVALVPPQPVKAEPTLRVRAQVTIDAHVVAKSAAARSSQLYVEGTLQDDLGARLADRQLSVAFHGGSTSPHGRLHKLETDPRGQFAMPAPCVACEVTLEFPGDAYYERRSLSLTVALERPALRLEIVEPAQLAVALDEPQLQVVVRASGSGPLDGVSITLENELARKVGGGQTGADGVLRTQLDSRALGPYGLGELVAFAAAEADHGPARASKAVLRTLSTQTQLRATYAAQPRRLHLEVALQTRAGPVSGRAIGVFIDREHFTTLVTDEHGRGSGDFSLGETALGAGPHRVTAAFQTDIPGLLSSRSAAVPLEITPPQHPSIAWLLLPVLGSIAFVLWSARRAPAHARRAETVAAAGPEVRMGQELRGRVAPQLQISGRVEDVDTGQPLEAALEFAALAAQTQLVHVVQTDADGRFVTDALLAGEYQVRVVAPGYAPVLFTLSLPHHGAGNDMQIAARSLRVIALDAYSRFAARLLPEARTRGKTVRETFAAAVGCGKGTPAVDEIAGATERIAYARAIPYEGDLVDLQRSAATALHELGDPGAGASDPDLGW